ncbi:hypothetical protein Hanom_Chr00s137260g01817751 [Helianthus anomalus]
MFIVIITFHSIQASYCSLILNSSYSKPVICKFDYQQWYQSTKLIDPGSKKGKSQCKITSRNDNRGLPFESENQATCSIS